MTDLEIHLNAPEDASPEELASYLDKACGGDPALRERVEALFAAEAEASSNFLEESPMETDRTLIDDAPLTEGPGTVIGRYKLLQNIGEGGMGVVYMAEQTEPVNRKVALKVIKLGMDTKQVVARFEAERQALAMMDHPNIAKVLDAGSTDTGRPYFVMELVRGVPITEYCDKNKLNTKERLELFMPVCQAIQHAHQKGVIHRDIKPSNVMVTLSDGGPLPKVIDFGIAKATNQKLTEKTLFTNYAQMIGTPAYMSPEQAEMSATDVDTRTDVYSLGVLLYELLTGTTPFPSRELMSMGYGEMQRIIAEKEPPKPSTRLSTMENDTRTVVAKNRSMEISAMGRTFQGDLDWIVMRALEKDRTHRYETANGLVSDIKRHLNNEPVSAAPPAFTYQLRKFYRRNRNYMRAAAATAGLLVVVAAIAIFQGIRATRAEHRAMNALFDATMSQIHSGTLPCQDILDRLEEHFQDTAQKQVILQFHSATNAEPRARFATVALQLGDPGPARHLLAAREDPKYRTAFIHVFSNWHGELDGILSQLNKGRNQRDEGDLRSGICAALGLMVTNEISEEAIDTLSDWYIESPDGGTHSGAAFVLKKLGRQLPGLPQYDSPSVDRDWFVNSAGMTMIRMPSDAGNENSGRSSETFYMSAFEVTQEQWEKLMMNNPSEFEGANCPVAGVSWNDIERFCEQLTQQEKGNLSEGFQYRLPYRGEWEYACRAGTKTKYCFGDSEDRLTDYGWYVKNHDNSMQPKPVGLKIFNSWGLHDMHGSVWEWCHDREGANAWVRGGGWGSPTEYCVSDIGASRDSSLVNETFGFRVVLARSSPHQ